MKSKAYDLVITVGTNALAVWAVLFTIRLLSDYNKVPFWQGCIVALLIIKIAKAPLDKDVWK